MKLITGPQYLGKLSKLNRIFTLSTLASGETLHRTSIAVGRKDLNDPNHLAIAHEYMISVVVVFEYLNIPQIQTNMRDTFNKISGDFGEMRDALNARRKA